MNPHPAPPHADEHPDLTARNARSGWWLFAVYLVLYAGFVGLNAFAPSVMATRPLGGIDLAILYGLGLIVAAIALALIYMYICKRAAVAHAKELRSDSRRDPSDEARGSRGGGA